MTVTRPVTSRVTSPVVSRVTDGQRRRVDDALSYIAAVEAADGEALEAGVKTAYIDFIDGCKADDIWDAIKASCILAGARTLAGCLVPLVGPAPTNVGPFVTGDYNRITGLKGGGVKRLGANYAYTSAMQNNCHAAVYQTGDAGSGVHLGTGDETNNGTLINSDTVKASRHYNFSSSTFTPTSPSPSGFQGVSRAASASYTYRSATGNQTASIASTAIALPQFSIFARTSGTVFDGFTDVRQSFYSLGESLNLANLDTRVTALMTAIGAALS